MTVDTLCVQGGWSPKKGESRQVPIISSTTFRYETSEQMADLFDLKAPLCMLCCSRRSMPDVLIYTECLTWVTVH